MSFMEEPRHYRHRMTAVSGVHYGIYWKGKSEKNELFIIQEAILGDNFFVFFVCRYNVTNGCKLLTLITFHT